MQSRGRLCSTFPSCSSCFLLLELPGGRVLGQLRPRCTSQPLFSRSSTMFCFHAENPNPSSKASSSDLCRNNNSLLLARSVMLKALALASSSKSANSSGLISNLAIKKAMASSGSIFPKSNIFTHSVKFAYEDGILYCFLLYVF